MALQELLDWQESLYYVKDSLANSYNILIDTVAARIDTFYALITTSERAAVAFLAGILVLYSTIAITILVDEARGAYKRMPK